MSYHRKATLNPATQRIELAFSFNWNIIEELKKIKGWNYDPSSKEWDLPLCKESIDRIINLNFELTSSLKSYYDGIINPKIEKKEITITVDNYIRIPEGCFSPFIVEKIRRLTSFTAPSWNNSYPKYYNYLYRDGKNWIIPRGILLKLKSLLEENNIGYEIVDKTRFLPKIDFGLKIDFGGLKFSPYPYQYEAINAILDWHPSSFCVLNSPTGSGKTVMALYIIAERKQPTCVIVHTKELLYQWKAAAEEFLGLSGEQIGLVGDGNKSIGTHITIGIVNSLQKHLAEVKDKIGFLVVDEVHRTPGEMFTKVVNEFDCYYVLGLSATPYRKDKLTPVIHLFCGETAYNISPQELIDVGKIMKGKLITSQTDFTYYYNDDYQDMITSLIADDDRNELIADGITDYIINSNGIALVISNRKIHFKLIQEKLDKGIETAILTSDVPSEERKKIVEQINTGEIDVLFATRQLIGEGFDCKRLSAIFMASPISYKGAVIQNIGRILRMMEGKEEAIIYDYVDNVGVLKASFYKRCRAYRELGIEID